DILQPEAALAQQRIVRLRLDGRVDNRRVVGAARGNDVGGASTAFVQELLEIHEENSGSSRGCIDSPPDAAKVLTALYQRAGPGTSAATAAAEGTHLKEWLQRFFRPNGPCSFRGNTGGCPMKGLEIEAVYENGSLKLPRSLPLSEGQKVTITI